MTVTITEVSPQNNTIYNTNVITVMGRVFDSNNNNVALELQIAKKSDFSILYKESIGKTFSPSGSSFGLPFPAMPQGNYYIRIRGANSLGEKSAWSSTASIFVDVEDISKSGYVSAVSMVSNSGFVATDFNYIKDFYLDPTADNTWLMTVSGGNSNLRVKFPTLDYYLNTSATQTIYVACRATGYVVGQKVQFKWYINGVLSNQSVATLVSDTTGTWVGAPFTPPNNYKLENFEVEVIVTGATKGKNSGTVDIGAVIIDYNMLPYYENIGFTVNSSYPIPTITNVSKSKISNNVGSDRSTIKFKFDKDVVEWVVRCVGTSYDTGIMVDSYVGNVMANTECVAIADYTELYGEGQNKINIYGKGADGSWTLYEQ